MLRNKLKYKLEKAIEEIEELEQRLSKLEHKFNKHIGQDFDYSLYSTVSNIKEPKD